MGGSSKRVTVGYKYYLGMHMVLSHGPIDFIREIKVDNKIAYGQTSSGGSIFISAASLFGGQEREGGIEGGVDILMGGNTQGPNAYLQSQLGANIPAFRKVVSVILKQVYLGVNPYLKKWSFYASRIHVRQDGIEQWQDGLSEIRVFDTIGEGTQTLFYSDDFAGALGPKYTNPRPSNYYVSGGFLNVDDTGLPIGVNDSLTYDLDEGLYNYCQIDFRKVNDGIGDHGRFSVSGFCSVNPQRERTVDAAQRCQLGGVYVGTTALDNDKWYRVIITRDTEAAEVTYNLFERDTELLIHTLTLSVANVNSTQVDYGQGMDGSSFSGGMLCQYDNVIVSVGGASGDMNPAHIIRECLTDPDWGMGYSEADIDEPSFLAAAQRLYAEQFGLSLVWDRQTTIEEFVGEIIKHIDAAIYVDRKTGKFVLKLIRFDYDVGDLLVLDKTNSSGISNPNKPDFGELTSSVTVIYVDRDTREKASVTASDPALAQMQNSNIGTTVQYPGISRGELAARVAQRDLKALSAPFWSFSIIANRDAENLNPGEPVIVNWPEYGMDNLVMRVTAADLGDTTKARVRLALTEDVFNLVDPNTGAIIVPEPEDGWVDPVLPPEPLENRLVFETPYYELVTQLGMAGADQLLTDDPDAGYLTMATTKNDAGGGEINVQGWVDSGAGYTNADTVVFSPYAILSEGVSKTATTFNVSEFDDVEDDFQLGGYAEIGGELVRVDAIDQVLMTVTVGRGVLDTTPKKHEAGARLSFISLFLGSDEVEYTASDDVDVKLLPVTGVGVLDIADAIADNVVFASRAIRPYPPGNVTFDGVLYGEVIDTSTNFTIDWDHRDRLQQTGAVLIDATSGNIGPEAGTTYSLLIYDEQNDIIVNETGLLDGPYNLSLVNEVALSEIPAEGGAGVTVLPLSDEILADTPYVYYKLDETSGTTATDSSGNGRNGTYNGSITKNQTGLVTSEPSGVSAYFSGATTDTRIATPITTNLTTALTMESVVKPSSTAGDDPQVLWSKSRYFASPASSFPISLTWNASNGWFSLVLSKGDDFSQDATISTLAALGALPPDEIYHVVAVYRAMGLCEIYVNGVQAASTTIDFTISSSTYPFALGCYPNTFSGGAGNGTFEGNMDDSALYDYGLSAERILAHSNSVFNPVGVGGDFRPNGQMRVVLKSVRDTYESWQAADQIVFRAGYGYNYGYFYGGSA